MPGHPHETVIIAAVYVAFSYNPPVFMIPCFLNTFLLFHIFQIKRNSSDSYELPPISICPSAWLDDEKAPSLDLSSDAIEYSLGYIDTYPKIRINDIKKAKTKFLNICNLLNFSSMHEYLKAVALDFKTVYNMNAFNNYTNIKIGDSKALLLSRLFISF